jgi:hypothetical protein
MSDIFSGIGQVAGAAITANAMENATKMQIDALQRQKDFVFKQLDPNVVGPQATQADVDRAKNQLALQAQIDPALLAQRYASQEAIGKAASELGAGSPSDLVAKQAAKEAVAGVPGEEQAKKAIVDAAHKELSMGATLPPDVQAEIVKAGLEKTGQVQGTAGAQGVGGQILRTVLGTAGINLQHQRQQQAAALTSTAADLQTKRQNILQSLFPNLQAAQLKTLGAQQSVLQQSNAMVPQAGLGGTDVANLWLARVGATNQLAQSQANAAAAGAQAQGQIWGNTVANVAPYVGNQLPTTSSAYNWAKGIVSPGQNYDVSGSTPFMGDSGAAYTAILG